MSRTQQEAIYSMMKAERSAAALAQYVAPYSDPTQAVQTIMGIMGIPNQGLLQNVPQPVPNYGLGHGGNLTTGSQNVVVGHPGMTASYVPIPAVGLPTPSGVLALFHYRDAKGIVHSMHIDQAFVDVFKCLSYPPGPYEDIDSFIPNTGEFTLAEMEAAQDIIEELE